MYLFRRGTDSGNRSAWRVGKVHDGRLPTRVVSFETRVTSSSRVRNTRFLSPEMMQRSRTWTITGSKGNPGNAARTWASRDGRKSCVPGGGKASMLKVPLLNVMWHWLG